MKLQAGRLGQSATETTHANRSPVTRPVLANYWRSLNCATTLPYYVQNINQNRKEKTMTEKKCRACGNKLILLTSFIDGVQGESNYFHPNLQECPHVIFVRKQKNKRKVKQ
jgi:hypothetical protein